MSATRPFRFGIQGDTPAEEWITHAQRAESLGYDVLSVGEHVFTNLAPIPALVAAAMATSTIRLGTATLANDFHNPVILARDIATLDALSDGRVEFGLGSGFFQMDYAQAGVALDPPRLRLERLFESVLLLKATFGQETVDHRGAHYKAEGLTLVPRPKQRPSPPLMIGGGGRRVLSFAAREADIVSINTRTTAEGWFDWGSVSAEATSEKIAWVKEAAGVRFDDIELHMLITRLEITDDPEAIAREVIAYFAGYGPVDLTVDDILASPHFLIGSEEWISETLLQRREEYGITYFTVFDSVMEEFAPLARRLRGA